MSKLGFSIVMPTFQRRAVVCEAVSALGTVRYDGPLEIVLVVDGSTDGTEEALRELSLPFPLRIISQENRGLSAARNRGAQAASGDVLLFMDDDMMADPHLVEEHARSILAGADAVLGDIPLDPASPRNFLSAGVGEWAAERRARLVETGELTLFDLVGGQMSIRRKVFEEIGGFDTDFTRGGSFGDEDLDMGLRLIGRYRVVFNPEAVSYQRYVVSYEAHLRQWFQSGLADVAFARKHPDRAEELFELHGASSRAARRLYIPLSRLPGLSGALGRLSCRLARIAEGRGGRLAHWAERLYLRTRDLSYWRGVHLAGGISRRRPLLVLCYHAIGDLSDDPVLKPYAIPRTVFEQQLESLAARGHRFIGADELAAYLRGETGLPRGATLLTFDDCYEDLLDEAAPILAQRGIPALAFAVTGIESNTNEWDHRNGCTVLKMLDGQGLSAVAGLGIEIGAHSRTHRMLNGIDRSELPGETRGAADDIEALGLPRPRYFAYPHGEMNAEARAAVVEAGFSAAFTVVPERFPPGSDSFAIPRIEILRQDTGLRFWLKTAAPRLAARLFG